MAWRPPRLETERLVLRGWEPSDVEAVFAYASDPEVTPYMAWDRHRTVEDARGFLDGFVALHYQHREFDYAVCLREAPSIPVGAIGAYWQPKSHGVMELGYVLAKAHWGRGYVPEAARAVLRHVFEATGVQRVFAPIFAENTKSRRAAEKIGMTFEGIHRSALAFRGRRWDQAIYAMLRDEYDRLLPALHEGRHSAE